MEIYYQNQAYKKMCPDWKCVRSFGNIIGRKILQRVAELRAANCLEDLRYAPGRHEELSNNRKFQLSCRLSSNWRLVYQPYGNINDYLTKGALSWDKVNKIEIIETVDYHNN